MLNPTPTLLALLALSASVLAAPQPQPLGRLTPRQSSVSCFDSENSPFIANANVAEAVECINELASKGSQACVAGLATSFCRRGDTQITGINSRAASGEDSGSTTTTTCNDVARAAGRIMDFCSRGDGTVRGQTNAFDNTDMLVDIRLNVE